MRRECNAKIVATLGPASAPPEMLQKRFAAAWTYFGSILVTESAQARQSVRGG